MQNGKHENDAFGRRTRRREEGKLFLFFCLTPKEVGAHELPELQTKKKEQGGREREAQARPHMQSKNEGAAVRPTPSLLPTLRSVQTRNPKFAVYKKKPSSLPSIASMPPNYTAREAALPHTHSLSLLFRDPSPLRANCASLAFCALTSPLFSLHLPLSFSGLLFSPQNAGRGSRDLFSPCLCGMHQFSKRGERNLGVSAQKINRTQKSTFSFSKKAGA